MIVEAGRGHEPTLPVGGRFGGEDGELVLGLRSVPLQGRQLCSQELGVKSGSGLDGDPGQPLGEREVVTPPGHERGLQHQLRAGVASLQAPGPHPEDVRPPAGADRLDHVRQHPGDVPRSQMRSAAAQNIAVERVRQAEHEAPAVHRGDDQPFALEALGDGRVAERGQLGGAQRLSQRHGFQEGPLGGLEPQQPALDQLRQPGRGR